MTIRDHGINGPNLNRADSVPGAGKYDYILQGGRIIDGTGKDEYVADVGVKGGKIVDIGDLSRKFAKHKINVKGKVVSPGFIDTHSHSDLSLHIKDKQGLNMGDTPKIKQGVTTQVIGQDGLSVAPVDDDNLEALTTEHRGLNGVLPLEEWKWRSMEENIQIMSGVIGTNIASLVGHSTIRQMVMGSDNRKPSSTEMGKMGKVLEDSMKQGAIGMSTGLIYHPACYADKKEVAELCKTVAKHDGVFMVHVRNECDDIENAMQEMIDVTRESGVHLHVSHLKVAGSDNWKKMDSVLNMLSKAKEEGMNITADQYPYIAGSTTLSVILPPWVKDGGSDKAIERLKNPDIRAQMREQILKKGPRAKEKWDNFFDFSADSDGVRGWPGIQITSMPPDSKHKDMEGKLISEILHKKGIITDAQDPEQLSSKEAFDFVFDLLIEERLGISMVDFCMSEDNVKKVMKSDFVNVCTDGLVSAKPHPRLFGSFPRVLGKYTREEGALTLPEAVNKMTLKSAEAIGIADRRGSLEIGKSADITVFNPDTIIDKGTFDNPNQTPEGIDYVFVNGELAYDNHDGKEKVIDNPHGKIIRHDNGYIVPDHALGDNWC